MSATYLKLSGEGDVDSLRYSVSSISYALGSPTARPTGAITLKYSTGRNPTTMELVRDLTLGLGFKY